LGASVYKLTASLFFKSAFLTGTVTFIGAYMYLVYSASAAIVGIFLSVTFLPAILGQYAFGILTERYGNRSMFSLTTILMVLFFLLFLLSNNIYVASLLYSIFVLVGFTAFPISMSYSSRLAAEKDIVHANSFVWGYGTILGSAAGVAVIT
ncbi:major facilitator transporter, partial [mine drainage metagenome]